MDRNINRNSDGTLSEAARDRLPFITAELNYCVPGGGRPRTYACDPPAGQPRSTVVQDRRTLPIHDMRGVAPYLSLDREGFALVARQSAASNFHDEREVKAVYYPEVERILADVSGADRVFVFDHTIRRRIPGAADDRTGPRQPVERVHVDHTVKSGPQRVRDLLGDEAEALLRGRVQIVNLWRPLRGPLRDRPLAVCDAQSIRFGDLVPSDLVYRDRIGETYQVIHNPAHRWFFVPKMDCSEALLIKCFDSETDGRARFAPHTAFVDKAAPADAPPRQSIEVRAMLFHRA